MKKKIIWHLGFRKTGTTSVQYLLEHLPSAEYPNLFVSSRDSLTKNWRQHIVAATRNKTRPNALILRKEMAIVASILRSSPAQTILISDENLFAFSLFAPDGSHFFEWAAEVLPLIETEFSDFDNVFVAYTRPLETWLKSSYSQEVKRGRTWLSYQAWHKKVPHACNWTDGLALVRASLTAPLILLTQENATDTNRPLGTQLLEMVGVTPQTIAAIGLAPHLNQSLSPFRMRVLRLFNFLGLNGLVRAAMMREVKAHERLRAVVAATGHLQATARAASQSAHKPTK